MEIRIKGAFENNLKHIDLNIPKNKLIVFTGLSGSGKSTLAMETLQRECQRQYMESMGLLMELGARPKVVSIEGLSPAISISQQSTNRNPRSTVGTITELAPYLRVLFSKLGERPCPHCGVTISGCGQESDDFIFSEVADGEADDSNTFEQTVNCPHCLKPVIELTASHFSFNKPQGACPTCKGVGMVSLPNIDLLIDKNKSVMDFAIHGWDQVYIDRYSTSLIQASKHYGFPLDIHAPIQEYGEIQRVLLLYGVLSPQFSQDFPDIPPPRTVPAGRFEGVVTNLMRRYEEKSSYSSKQRLEKFLHQQQCPACNGIRFCSDALNVTVFGKSITQALSMSLEQMHDWLGFVRAELPTQSTEIVGQVLSDLLHRTNRLISVGAGYLCMDQPAGSLSSGEIQRIKLASILGSGLTGVLYVLDEPTAGLHPIDRKDIIEVLQNLRDMGNTVLVIEHDMELMRAADYLVDFGPGAGENGGRIVAAGTLPQITTCEESITGKYLNKKVPLMHREKKSDVEKSLHIPLAQTGNLKQLELDIPLGRIVAVSGVSGAGKTSLVFGVLGEAAETYFNTPRKKHRSDIQGFEELDAVVSINSTSIGRSTRSNIATYIDLFTDIRSLFAQIASTQNPSLDARHFSYNVAGGRCEKCQGNGKLMVSMHFLPDVEVTCPVCHGRRYQQPVLDIKYKEHNISDILNCSVDKASILLAEEKSSGEKLQTLQEVGLGYIKLGQSTATLSGGEAQRLKLAKELSKHSAKKTLYLFDEPTTGLHPQDVDRLIGMFHRLVAKGNSIIIVEHNSRVLLSADWIIDLGPKGGNQGGCLVAQGTPKDIMESPASFTGKTLAQNIDPPL